MRRLSIPAVVATLMFATFSSPATAVDPLSWKGQSWTVNGPATAQVVNDEAVLTRTAVGEVNLHVDRVIPAEGQAALSQSPTPWVEFTYVDDGSNQGIDLFIEHTDHENYPRLSGGSLFSSCDGIAYSRHSDPAVETVDFAVGCETPNRANVAHTVRVGQRADGTIDWMFDGVSYPSTFLKDKILQRFAFNDVLLRWRDKTRTSGSVTFKDFKWGTDHVAPAVPEPPAVGAVGVGDTRASVRWEAPASSTPINKYVVIASPGGQSVTTDGAARTATFSGLTNGTGYRFTVRALNDAGSSLPSAPSEVATPGSTLSWEGQAWEVLGPGAAAVSDGRAVITRTGTGLVDLHLDRVLDSGGTPALSEAQSPWVRFTYTDNGSDQGIDLFIEHEEHPDNLRLSSGSLFTGCDGIGYSRHSNPAVENVDFSVGCQTPGRALNKDHEVFVGQRADGSIDWSFDGVVMDPSTVLKDKLAASGGPRFSFSDVHLRWRDKANSSGALTLKDFEWGTDHVAPLPGAPVIGTARAGQAQATVTWKPPPHDGGTSITGYVVTASPGGKTVTTDGAGRIATMTGLTNGTSYTFTVQALNRIGGGPLSAKTNAVTPVAAAPGAPIEITVTPGDGEATVSWTAPPDDGGSPVTGYTVTVNPGGKTVRTDGNTTTATIAGLTADVPYFVTVQAENALGAGPAVVPLGGYWMVAADGGVFSFGDGAFFGSTGERVLNKPIVGMASTPSNQGYWMVAGDGGVFSFGDAQYFGSTGDQRLNQPIVGITATPTGQGYWMVAADGGVFSFGDAEYFGSTGSRVLNQPVVGMTATPSGEGYWLVASDGGMFSFGDAEYFGSTGDRPLNQPIVGMAATPTGLGYWLVASDGGVFSFGNAGYFGSTGDHGLNRPVTGMIATPSGLGYWMVASDGGVFSFGDAPFVGSAGDRDLNRPVVGITPAPKVLRV